MKNVLPCILFLVGLLLASCDTQDITNQIIVSVIGTIFVCIGMVLLMRNNDEDERGN